MARGVYYSGDLVGLNDAMASEEMNRIRARTANQGFLGQLVGESTKRRGQDTEERIAKGRNETDLGVQQSRAGEQRYATDAVKEKNAFDLQNDIQRYQLERDKLAEIKANAASLNALENRKLDALIKDNATRGKQLVAIALIQSQAMQNRMDPRIGVETAGINAGIADQNQAAQAAAQFANLKADNAEWDIFGKPTKGDMEQVFSSLPPDQQALLSIDLNARQFNPRVRPSVDPRTGLPVTPILQSPAPSVATPPISGNRVFTPDQLRLRNLPQGTGPLIISGGSPTNAMPTMGGAGQLDLQSILQMLAQ